MSRWNKIRHSLLIVSCCWCRRTFKLWTGTDCLPFFFPFFQFTSQPRLNISLAPDWDWSRYGFLKGLNVSVVVAGERYSKKRKRGKNLEARRETGMEAIWSRKIEPEKKGERGMKWETVKTTDDTHTHTHTTPTFLVQLFKGTNYQQQFNQTHVNCAFLPRTICLSGSGPVAIWSWGVNSPRHHPRKLEFVNKKLPPSLTLGHFLTHHLTQCVMLAKFRVLTRWKVVIYIFSSDFPRDCFIQSYLN